MTKQVKAMLAFLQSGEYKSHRVPAPDISELVEGKDWLETVTVSFEEMMKAEKPNLFENDIYGFNRTLKRCPIFHCADGKESSEFGPGNIIPNYGAIIGRGFDDILLEIHNLSANADNSKKAFYNSLTRHIHSIFELAERYRKAAEERGNHILAKALKTVPHHGASSLYEACLFLKILLFSLRCARHTHTPLGRFDQYMYPYYCKDVERGISREELLETIELFFIAINYDIDLYAGVQAGDNGQSMVLGGFDGEGNDQFNQLSQLCMEASLELSLIDPKINLRVGKKTPFERYELATRLTKKGLGFPQYCNDDIVVPGLTALGYDREDALNYGVAACWEYIIPNCSADIPNIAVFNFPLVVNNTVHSHLSESKSFEEFLGFVVADIKAEVDRIVAEMDKRGFSVSPMLSLMVDDCIQKGMDVSQDVAKYNCSGCHGAGIANAADALAAIKKTVFEEKYVTAKELITALDADFSGYSDLRNHLLSCPKMGNNDDYVDDIAGTLMDAFSSSLNSRPNGRGGFWRAGTGSAMEYILSARQCPATADGRKAWESYSSSFSPSITTKLKGPLSVIQSFTKFDMKKIINGGPLTMELHDTVFRNPEGERKVAQLVKLFIDLGGHQLQLNSVNRERLLEAQKHPEKYPNLIVRVWGWSGYFCELDKEYQDHIIKRTEFSV